MGRRILNIVLLAVMIVGAIVTYEMKRRAEMAANEVARLESDIATQKDRLSVLRAEWSLLTQPGRLQAIVEEHGDYFQLAPFAPNQIATIGDIPLKPVGSEDQVQELIARLAEETGNIE